MDAGLCHEVKQAGPCRACCAAKQLLKLSQVFPNGIVLIDLQISKLQEQYEADSFQLPTKSNIFQGVCIFVNGYTQPSLQVCPCVARGALIPDVTS
jgi:hypothetical protein